MHPFDYVCHHDRLSPPSGRFGLRVVPGIKCLISVCVFWCVCLSLSGCVTDSGTYIRDYAHNMVESRAHSFNALTYDSKAGMIGSVAAVAGGPRRELTSHDLVLRDDLAVGNIRIKFYIPAGHDSATADRLLTSIAADNSVRGALARVLSEITQPMENVVDQELVISLVVVPSESGYLALVQSDRHARPLEFVFFAVFYPLEEVKHTSAEVWWGQQVMMVSHELQHLEHLLGGAEVTSEFWPIDSETAAELTGWCAKARFFQSLGIRGRDGVEQISLPSEHKFPGIYQGVFSPDLTKFSTARYDATSNGQEMARAILFNFVTHGDIYLDLGDPEQTALLFDLCEGLPKHIPRYSSGEIK